jgi:large subunit ribosomal protein L24
MIKNKMKIKKGDTVKVLSGKDKGKTGKVISVVPSLCKVVVEGLNLHTRFQKSRKAGQPGTKITMASPMPVSKVQLVDPASGKPTRVGYKFMDDGTKQRIAKKSGQAV